MFHAYTKLLFLALLQKVWITITTELFSESKPKDIMLDIQQQNFSFLPALSISGDGIVSDISILSWEKARKSVASKNLRRERRG